MNQKKNDAYIVRFVPVRDEAAEILSALSFECDADGVAEEGTVLTASFTDNPADKDAWHIISAYCREQDIQIDTERQPWKNWNEIWEKSFDPVTIADQIVIRAPFHAEVKEKINIIIEPAMAFGTGHHATTAMVMELMTAMDFEKKNVLDFGCGSGILSVLAARLGAGKITAIDYDAVATENTEHNLQLNEANDVHVLTGEKNIIPDEQFDVILANINKNVILDAISDLSNHLAANGVIIFSGILNEDEKEIISSINQFKLMLKKRLEKDNWLALVTQKK